MKTITLQAKMENLNSVISMIEGELAANGCPLEEQTQISVACEEIFVNIACYGYTPGEGDAVVSVDISGNSPKKCVIVFDDSGNQFNPLEKPDPDVTLAAVERPIGGLGIYMVKNTMDNVSYEYINGHNILTIIKSFN